MMPTEPFESRTRRPTRAAARLAGLTTLVVALVLPASGCGNYPQVSGEHRRLVLSLATAASARNPEWLEANARIVEDLRGQARLTAAEDEVFSSILAKARSGDWDTAREEAYALRDSQEPTAETSDAVQKRELPKAKKPIRRPGIPGGRRKLDTVGTPGGKLEKKRVDLLRKAG